MERAFKRDLIAALLVGLVIEGAIWILTAVPSAQRWQDVWFLITGYSWERVISFLSSLQEPGYKIGEFVVIGLYKRLGSTLHLRHGTPYYAYIGSICGLGSLVLMWAMTAFVAFRVVALFLAQRRAVS